MSESTDPVQNYNVLVVQDKSTGEIWTTIQETNFDYGTKTTFRRAKLYVRVDDDGSGPLRLSMVYNRSLADALGLEELAAEIGRQFAIAIKTSLEK